jgi:DNA-binding beta-propeller fold protein YncE
MNWTGWSALVALYVFIFAVRGSADEPHRSPLALATSPGRTVCLTANHSAGTVTLVDMKQRQILAELSVGCGPTDVVWLDEGTALVSLRNDDSIAVVKRDGTKLTLHKSVEVGDEPGGLAVSTNRRRVFVALGGEDSVAVLDLDRLLSTDVPQDTFVVGRIAVGGIPRTLAISPDDQWLVTCCAVPCEVFVHDISLMKEISARKIFDGGFNPGVPAVTSDSQLVVLPSAVNRAFSVTAGMIDIGWVIDNRLTKLPLPDGEPSDQKQLGLDIRGKAVGDANAVAFSPDGKLIVVTCGGTHELLVLNFTSIPWPSGDPGDFLPDVLRKDVTRFRRIKLGGRPVDVEFAGEHQVVVANYLADSLQFVDLVTDQVTETVRLGGPDEPGIIRRGEIVFYDADRSLHSWFSCHTCHTDGHTSGQVFDTRNDRTYGTPKLIPSLRGVAETGPWTWHGWQTDLKDAMKRSLTESMNTEKPISDDDVESLAAYMETIVHPQNPRSNSTSPNVMLGRQLFVGRAGCYKCHAGTTFTTVETFDGAVEDPKDKNKLYNPPSLKGVSTRRRFLHTGKGKSLEQVLTKLHRPEDLVGETLNETETSALIDYLKSL